MFCKFFKTCHYANLVYKINTKSIKSWTRSNCHGLQTFLVLVLIKMVHKFKTFVHVISKAFGKTFVTKFITDFPKTSVKHQIYLSLRYCRATMGISRVTLVLVSILFLSDLWQKNLEVHAASTPPWARRYTGTQTGCPCWFDLSRGMECACCKGRGIQCGFPKQNFCQRDARRSTYREGCKGNLSSWMLNYICITT